MDPDRIDEYIARKPTLVQGLGKLLTAIELVGSYTTQAEPLAALGDTRLRHDLQLLNDSEMINIPLTAWPLPLASVSAALQSSYTENITIAEQDALRRVRDYLSWELYFDDVRFSLGLAAAEKPRIIRSFEDMPREDGEASVAISWMGDLFALNLSAKYVASPLDGEQFRPDGTYAGIVLGNWMLTAGWQERWWGPGRDGSLILGTNARLTPGISLQRNLSTAFRSKWLRWMGPWTITTFMNILDDERAVNDAWLFGIRGSFRPPNTGLELGISRMAQWCGDDRPCDFTAFLDLLAGNDNRGVNVEPADEPGNRLGGFDIRWRLPASIPIALYMQWIGEDGSGGGGAVGPWLRQTGFEHWGRIGGLSHRTHLEISDSTCRERGFGFGDLKADCAYEHSTYQAGYRYRGRSLGHPGDGDTLSYSLGSTLVESNGAAWSVLLRYLEINRAGLPNSGHSLTPTPQELIDVAVAHDRLTRFGRFQAGIGYSHTSDPTANSSSSEAFGFMQWSSN